MSGYSIGRTVIGRIRKGDDLYNGIAAIAREHGIRVGRVTGIGSVEKAAVAFYDQKRMEYAEISINEPMEIVSLYGNVSLKEGSPFPHVHVVLSDARGNGKGGHLLPGTTPVFACEITIEEYDGEDLVRALDDETGLYLWQKDMSTIDPTGQAGESNVTRTE